MSVPAYSLLELEPLLSWLQAEPDVDPGRELLAAQRQGHTLAGLDMAPDQMRDLLDLFYGRLCDLVGRYRVRLLESGLPLPRELHLPVRRVVQLCVEVAQAYLEVAGRLAADLTRTQRLGEGSLGAHALDLVSEAWVVGTMGGMAAPAELWATAHNLFLACGGPGPESGLLMAGRDDRALRAYKRLLTLAVIQAESYSAREVAWVADFLDEQAAIVGLEPLEAECASGYWVDPAQEAPPVAVARRAPPTVGGLMHLATESLARVLTERLERLGSSDENAPDAIEAVVAVTVEADLPEGLATHELVALLRRLRQCWAMPPLRELPRRQRQYGVQICLGLRAIWEMGRHGEATADISQWVVLNESPGGFAVMSVAGAGGVLSAGMALALRREGRRSWSLCVVRWIRTENPSQVELGLQVVSEGGKPVRLGFRSGSVREMVHGLLLPPMGQVRRHQAILAPAGTYSSRRFVFVHEGERLYVAQGRLLSLDLQTAGVELFQFEVDPYPM